MKVLINKTVSNDLIENVYCNINFDFFSYDESKQTLQPIYKTEKYSCIDQASLDQITKCANTFAQYLEEIPDLVYDVKSDIDLYILFEKMPSIKDKKEFVDNIRLLNSQKYVA